MEIQGVLFDMDGLLLDTERVVLECCAEVARASDLPDLVPLFPGMIGLRADAANARLDAALAGRMEVAAFLEACDARITRRYADGIPLKPGAAALVAGLNASGVPMAVATSTRREKAQRHLETAGLFPHLDALVGGDDVSRGKPDPEIYHAAAAALSLTADACVAFEDSEPGVRAAHASGARVVQVPDIVAPSPDLRALGHLIAASLLDGAAAVGLWPRT